MLWLPWREWYDGGAVMVTDEGQVLAGLLVGLNAIDYNMTLSGDEFDKSVSGRERERERERETSC